MKNKIILLLIILLLIFNIEPIIFASETTDVISHVDSVIDEDKIENNTDIVEDTEDNIEDTDNSEETDEVIPEEQTPENKEEEKEEIIPPQIMSPMVASLGYDFSIANSNGTYTLQASYTTFNAAFSAMNASTSRDAVVRRADGKVLAMKEGIAITLNTPTYYLSSLVNGSPAYIQNNLAIYYNYTVDENSVMTTCAGFSGVISTSALALIPSAFVWPRATGAMLKVYDIDFYTKNTSGDLVHTINRGDANSTWFESVTIDKAPDFMEVGTRYHSSDGFTFYLDPFDVVKKVNPIGTHVIYYKYLSYRTRTNYSASELNSYISYVNSNFNVSVQSGLLGGGQYFINAQNTYGVNAALELAFAFHESGYGKSYYATSRYNFFGINAVDSNPNDASAFRSLEHCVYEHAYYFMSRGYLDAYAYIDTSKGNSYYNVPTDIFYPSSHRGDSRYFGSIPGDKALGINVRYASDPFHGEKVAGQMYRLDKYLGKKDYGVYTIGLTNSAVYAYSSPDTNSFALYRYSANTLRDSVNSGPVNMPLIILGEVGNFYKVQSDLPVNNELRAYHRWNYDYNRSVAYVLKSEVRIANGKVTSPPTLNHTMDNTNKLISKIPPSYSLENFKNNFSEQTIKVYNLEGTQITNGIIGTGMKVEIYDSLGVITNTYTAIVTGDVNGDGKISISDLVAINNHLLEKKEITSIYIYGADINGDGKISISDLVAVNNHLLEKLAITPR